MNFITACHTDIGIKKKTNQDALLIEQADTDYGRVLLAAICDGMGGLAKGEMASATMIKNLSSWFYGEFPQLLYRGLQPDALRDSWERLLFGSSSQIMNYGEANHISLGTTCVVFLVVQDVYYIMNVGDSRAYLLSDGVYLLTKDQTYCQREIDAGRMTPEQAATDPNRSVLLQCVGASQVIEPDFFAGRLMEGQCVMLCSDGFRHVVSPQELYDHLGPHISTDSFSMKQHLIHLVETDKARGETDNISALLIKAV